MKNIKYIFVLFFFWSTCSSCGARPNYSFKDIYTGDAKTFKITNFKNYASQDKGSTFEPGMDLEFTRALQNRIQGQTQLNLVNSQNSDLLYEGEIVEYRISPMSATAQQTASQNRLSIGVNIRFTNNTKEDSDFEQRFSFFFDYPAESQLSSVKSEAHEIIFERITQDIFNASLADW